MAKLAVDTKNFFEKFSSGFRKQVGLLFWLLFLFILAYEFFVVRQALEEVLWTEVKPPPAKTSADTKLNFDDYDQVLERIAKTKSFSPQIETLENPFRPRP